MIHGLDHDMYSREFESMDVDNAPSNALHMQITTWHGLPHNEWLTEYINSKISLEPPEYPILIISHVGAKAYNSLSLQTSPRTTFWPQGTILNSLRP